MSHIKTANPFSAIHSNAWADPIDVPSLNTEISDFLRDRLEEFRVQEAPVLELKSSCAVLLLGQAGIGKTHLFARLRKHTGRRAVFVLSRPELGLEPSPRHVLSSIVRSFQKPILNDEEHKQADLIVGTAFAFLESDAASRKFPLAVLDDWKRRSAEEREEAISRIVDAMEKIAPTISVHYVENLLRLPFASKQEQRALFIWLSGREPSLEELARIHKKGMLDDLDLMPALESLGAMALFGTPIVLVFDQLENLCEEIGKNDRIVAYAKLVSELRDTVPGFLIVQMALKSEWEQRIHKAMGAGYASRIEQNVLYLRMPTEQEKRELIRCWWDSLLPAEQREKPFPYPFQESDVELWARDIGMTPRMLMQACGEAYRRAQQGGDTQRVGQPAQPPSATEQSKAQHPDESLRRQWEETLSEAKAEADEAANEGRGVSAEQLMSGLLALCSRLNLSAHEDAGRKPVPVLRVGPAGGETNAASEKIMIVLQQIHPASFAAALRVAQKIAGEQPVILWREKTFAVPKSWMAGQQQLAVFRGMKGAAFVQIESGEVVKLLALARFLAKARSQDLSADDGRSFEYGRVMQWIEQFLSIPSWPAARVLLETPPNPEVQSKPAGRAAVQMPLPDVMADARAGQRSKLNECIYNMIEMNGVISVDRMLSETRTSIPNVTQALVLEELRKMPIRILCGSIVVLKSLENHSS